MNPETTPFPGAAPDRARPDFEITHGPSFAMLKVDIAPGSPTLIAEAGSMVARSAPVTMEAKLNASPGAGVFELLKALFVALLRRALGGETFFVNHFGGEGSVWIAPHSAGAISHRRMAGDTLILSAGAFLASRGALDVRVRFAGLRSMLAREGAFRLEVSGHGDLFFQSYGGIHAIDVDGSYIVDTGHLVGFEGGLTLDVRGAGGGLLGLVASGEGLVAELRGKGRVYVQSRSLDALVGWVTTLLP
jgi:uncharacterized protein (TIGR00266 family)